MKPEETELVRVATGNAIEMKILESTLMEAGIKCRVVGEDLDGGLGTALTSSVELLISAADAERAMKLIEQAHHHHRHPTEKPHFEHPTSDPKPDQRERGPQHGHPLHRPLRGN